MFCVLCGGSKNLKGEMEDERRRKENTKKKKTPPKKKPKPLSGYFPYPFAARKSNPRA
jgi:hypothetical protein